MKRALLITSVFSLLILGCAEENKELDLVADGTMMSSEEVDTCLCNDLLIDTVNNTLTQDNEPFTGICIYNYPLTDKKYMVKSLLDGKLHGKISYYDQQGNFLMEEIYQNGNKKRSGINAPIDCECNELSSNKNTGLTYLDGIPFTGKCSEKLPETDKPYLEVAYLEGKKDGFTIFYDRNGETLYMEKYEKGELIKVIRESAN